MVLGIYWDFGFAKLGFGHRGEGILHMNNGNGHQKAHKAYKTIKATTASQGRLIVMAYEGMIRLLTEAVAALEKKEMGWQEAVCDKVVRVQGVLTHLMTSLDLDKGGEVGLALFGCYNKFYEQLALGNMYKDGGRLKGVMENLKPLRDAWEEADRKSRLLQRDQRPRLGQRQMVALAR